MAEYLSIDEAVAAASKSAGCALQQVQGKKIMFHGRMKNGKTVIMCTPQAKAQSQGFYWTDITEVQYDLLNSYDRAIIAFRLQGNRLTMCEWSTMRSHLTPGAMKYNANEGNHWKLNIYQDRIKITGNPNEIPLTAAKGNIWDMFKR